MGGVFVLGRREKGKQVRVSVRDDEMIYVEKFGDAGQRRVRRIVIRGVIVRWCGRERIGGYSACFVLAEEVLGSEGCRGGIRGKSG